VTSESGTKFSRWQGRNLNEASLRSPLTASAIADAQNRTYTSASSGSDLGIKRAFPRYDIYDTDCMLSVKPTPPTYKSVGGDGITLSKQGRVLLEFIPAKRPNVGKGTYDYSKKGLFSLSVEEIGTILAKTSNRNPQVLQFSRGGGAAGEKVPGDFYEQHIVMSVTSPEKVLMVALESSRHATFTFDFMLNGTGGQIGNTSLVSLSILWTVWIESCRIGLSRLHLQSFSSCCRICVESPSNCSFSLCPYQ